MNSNNQNKNVFDEKGEYAFYLRKSRADVELEERGEGETLARHNNMLIELAKRYNLLIGKVYKEIVSGESIEARPVVKELLRDVQDGRWKGIFVVEIERLARGDTMDQGKIAKSFKISNTKIFTPMKIYDPNDEFDEEYFEFGLFMSRREYKIINRRLQRGRLESVKEGKYIGNITPFGYDKYKLKNEKGFSLIRNDEAEIVEKIFDLYVKEDLSLNEVTRKLNILGLKPRHAKKWTVPSIRDIIVNPVYIGKIRWNNRKTKVEYKNDKLVKSRPRNENVIIYEGLHKPIINKEIWDLAVKKQKQNIPKVIRGNLVKNPLVGLVYCKECGDLMQRRPYTLKGKEDTLICINTECNNISAKLHIVEKQLILGLKKWLNNYEINIKQNNLNKADSNKEKNTLEKLINDKKNIEKQLFSVCELFEKQIYDLEMFKIRSESLKSDIKNIDNHIKELEDEFEHNKKINKQKDSIMPQIVNVLELYNKLDIPEEKNKLLRTIIKEVKYLKTTKAIKKDSDPTEFELEIYPYLPCFENK